jgi:small GTP-binding protein
MGAQGASTSDKPTVTHKIVLLGDMGVGKTCISIRYYSGKFSEAHEPTIGGSFMTKDVELDQHVVKFEMWDTAGQERFKSLIPSYIKDSAVAIVCYDVTSRESF